MDAYSKALNNQFKDLKIYLVKHDTSPTGLPCYIEAHILKKPRDPETIVLDLVDPRSSCCGRNMRRY